MSEQQVTCPNCGTLFVLQEQWSHCPACGRLWDVREEENATEPERPADQARMARLEAALRQLRRGHLVVDGDCWFSCPLATYDDGTSAYCGDDTGCTCGADAANAIIAAALEETADGA